MTGGVRCSHKFEDSRNCLKCGVHIETLRVGQRVDALELQLAVMMEAPAPISGHSMFERLVDVEKQLQKVLSLAGRVKLTEVALDIDTEEASVGRQEDDWRKQKQAVVQLLDDVMTLLVYANRCDAGYEQRNVTSDSSRRDALHARCREMRKALQS